MAIGVTELLADLVNVVKTTNLVGQSCFSVFDVDDMEGSMHGPISFPMAGVSYEGSRKHSTASDGTTKENPPSRTYSGQLITVFFLVIVALDYKNASSKDTKPDATRLLDQLRVAIPGYVGVNSRPWRFNGETKLETSVEGVIMYGQMWETDIPRISNPT